MNTKHLVRVAAKAVFAALDPLFGPFTGPRILIYHQVGVSFGREMEVFTDTFTKHLDWMQAHGQIVPLEEAIERRDEQDADRLFVLTFDDGFEDVYANAFPILRDRQLPFTLYLTTGPIDSGEPLDPRYPDARPLTWNQINEMAASGLVTLGAHTHTHADLTKASTEAITEELDTSNTLIEKHTGVRPRHFTYPWGWWSPTADPLVRERYDSATTGGGGPFTADTDLYRIPRIPIQKSDTMVFFRRKLKSGVRMEDVVRRGIVKRRKADHGNSGTRDLRILHVIDSLTASGGAENRLVDEVLAMTHAEHHVVRLFERGDLDSMLARAGIPVSYLGLHSVHGTRTLPVAVWRLRRLVRRLRPDVLHSSLFQANLVAQVSGAMLHPRVPVLSTLTRLEDERVAGQLFNRGGAPWKVRFMGLVARKCRRMTHVHHRSVGAAVKDSAVRYLGLEPTGITVIPRGLRLDAGQRPAMDEIRGQFGLPNGPLVVNVGRLSAPKGQVYLVRAFPEILEAIPGALLAIAGDPQDAEAEIREEIERLGLGDSVFLLGHRSDARELMAIADVFVMTSLVEGLPGVLIEAMAEGCPVVAFDIPSVREVILDDRHAVLVPVGNEAALAGAVIRVLSGETHDRERARARARDSFSLPRTADALRDLLEQVGNGGDSIGSSGSRRTPQSDLSLGSDADAPRSIVISNAYSDDNRGSAALNMAAIRFAQLLSPGAHVTLLSLPSETVPFRRAFRHTLSEYPETAILQTPIITKGAKWAPGTGSLKVAIQIFFGRWRHPGAAEKAIMTADLVMSRGGVVFYHRPLRGLAGLVRSAYPLLLARRFGIPSGLLSAHLGPFRGLSLVTARRLFRSVDLVSVRDDASAAWAERTGVDNDRIVAAADSVFLLERSNDKDGTLARRWGLVPNRFGVVTVSSEAYRSERYGEFGEKLRSELAHLLDAGVVDKVAVVVQVTADCPASVDFAGRMDGRAVLVDDDLPPRSLIDLYSQSRFVVGTRLHSAIFGLIGGVPSFPIDLGSDLNLPKARGVFASLGLEDWVVGFPGTDGLHRRVSQALAKETETKKQIREAVGEAQQDLVRLASVFGELVNT